MRPYSLCLGVVYAQFPELQKSDDGAEGPKTVTGDCGGVRHANHLVRCTAGETPVTTVSVMLKMKGGWVGQCASLF